MKKNVLNIPLLVLIISTVFASGCTPPMADSANGAPTQTQPVEEITVAAAADLIYAFGEIAYLYEQESGNAVNLIFSSSGTAREQIENGAPYDVYASANIKFVDDLIEKDKIIADSKELYAIGRVGAAVPINSSLNIQKFEDLLDPSVKKIAIANPDHAPYGLAAKQVLESLDLWEQLENRMVYGKDIQDTLALINSGNVEAGFISLSVVKSDEVNFLLADADLHQPLRQAIAVVTGTEHESAARAFIKTVNSPQGREIMKKYGFVLPEEL